MIIIRNLSESTFSHSDIVSLLHLSFQERLDAGLDFTCSYITEEYYKQKTENSIIKVAIDCDSNILVGTVSTTLFTDRNGASYGYMEYLAIHPDYKRKGIGTDLFQSLLADLKTVDYLLSDTAVEAKSSVLFHQRNGFHIIGLRSFSCTHYYSYLFRLQLSNKPFSQRVFHSRWVCYLLFVFSFIQTHLIKKNDGTYTVFWTAIRRIKNYFKSD